jgi:hypothetical protein
LGGGRGGEKEGVLVLVCTAEFLCCFLEQKENSSTCKNFDWLGKTAAVLFGRKNEETRGAVDHSHSQPASKP